MKGARRAGARHGTRSGAAARAGESGAGAPRGTRARARARHPARGARRAASGPSRGALEGRRDLAELGPGPDADGAADDAERGLDPGPALPHDAARRLHLPARPARITGGMAATLRSGDGDRRGPVVCAPPEVQRRGVHTEGAYRRSPMIQNSTSTQCRYQPVRYLRRPRGASVCTGTHSNTPARARARARREERREARVSGPAALLFAATRRDSRNLP